MDKAKYPLKPECVALQADKKYWYCRCGKSAKHPFCDGTHKGTEFTPQPFTPEQDGEVWLCKCNLSETLPYCDGSHKKLNQKKSEA